jgi:microcystin-dependent protein
VSAPFVAEIRIVGFNFPPVGWAYCNGQLLPISQNTALFALLGTFYGGDGKSTFALPNMQGNVAMFWGQSPGTSNYDLGQMGGSPSVTLIQSEMPVHTHNITANIGLATLAVGNTNLSYARASGGNAYKGAPGNVPLNPTSISIAGGSLPHNNMQPYLALNYVIALQGVFPARN